MKKQPTPLDKAIRATRRAAGSPRLSDEARGRVHAALREARAAQPESRTVAPWAWLSGPRLAAASAIPLALVATLVVTGRSGRLELPAPSEPEAGMASVLEQAPTRVTAEREGDTVSFRIANGRSVHRVYRATSPDGFDDSRPVAVENGGLYVDRHEPLDEARETIVYYRIE